MRYLFFLLLCLSCGDDKLPKVEKLDSFRILGAIATPPEVAPGGASDIQLIVSDVTGTSPSVTGSYVICIDPGVSRGAKVECPAPLSTGTHTLNFATLVPDSDLRTGVNAATLNVSVPATILSGRSNRDQSNGVAVLVIFRFSVDGREHFAFKRIIATSRGSLNANPVITDMLANGTPLTTAAPPKGADLGITTSTPPEQYDLINVDDSLERKTEEYQVAWYSNVAEFSKPKMAYDDEAEIKKQKSGASVYLAILRDERGGMTVIKKSFP